MRYPILFILLLPLITQAQIATDGTLGQALNLPGPDYQIDAHLGQQQGGNLFHSFQNFNLQHHESATFFGPETVQNIISRVTGGHPSQIDGLIRSTIPNADIYLLNPYGLMFGPNTRLDIPGSFHASTAHYLRLADGGRFEALSPNQSVLTVAPIEAFGFLDHSIAPIAVKGFGDKKTQFHDNTQFKVSEGKTVSLIGGDLKIENEESDFDTRQGAWQREPNFWAPDGRINLVSVASQGEVRSTDLGLALSDFDQLGLISLNKTTLKTNGKKAGKDLEGGSIFIRGDQILLQKGTTLEAETEGRMDGGIIDIKARLIFLSQSSLSGTTWEKGGNASEILVQAGNLVLEQDSRISSDSFGKGHANQVKIKAQQVTLKDSLIASIAYREGNSAKIIIETDNLFLNSGYISCETRSLGRAGDINIQADGMIKAEGAGLSLSGDFSTGQASMITSLSTSEGELNGRSGQGGNISIKANQLIMKDGGQISTSSIAPIGSSSSQGGNIKIIVKGRIELSGVNPYGENQNGFGTGIYARSQGIGDNAGAGGTIELQAGTLQIEAGAVIESSTNNNANSGDIHIEVDGNLHISGDAANIELLPPAQSQIEYQTQSPSPSLNQSISGIYAHSKSLAAQAGQSGNIDIKAQNLTLADKAILSTSTAGGGPAGNITIEAKQIHLETQAIIASESQFSNIIEINTAEELKQFIELNDVVEITDTGEGKSGFRQNIDHRLVAIAPPVDTVADEEALYQLSRQYDYLPEGWIVKVRNGGGDQSAYYRYDFDIIYNNQSKENVKLEKWEPTTDQPNLIQIKDKHQVRNIAEMNQLKFAQTGLIVKVNHAQTGEPSHWIYSGQKWLPLNRSEVYRTVKDINELNELSAQVGELVRVIDAGNGQYEDFLYTAGEWQKQIRGGNAGTLTLRAHNGIDLLGGSQMTTKTASSGGGNMTLIAGGLLQIEQSEISSSVKTGVGDGGNLTLNPKFIVLEQGKILAQADEGHGGNMNITTTGIYHFGNKAANSIDASSDKGIDGEVEIDSPDTDVSGQLLVLSNEFLTAADQIQDSCASKRADNLSRLVVIPKRVTFEVPDGFLSSGSIPELEPATTAKFIPNNTTAKHEPQPALAIGCQPNSSPLAPLKTQSLEEEIPEPLF